MEFERVHDDEIISDNATRNRRIQEIGRRGKGIQNGVRFAVKVFINHVRIYYGRLIVTVCIYVARYEIYAYTLPAKDIAKYHNITIILFFLYLYPRKA